MKCTIDVAIVRLRSHCVGDVNGPFGPGRSCCWQDVRVSQNRAIWTHKGNGLGIPAPDDNCFLWFSLFSKIETKTEAGNQSTSCRFLLTLGRRRQMSPFLGWQRVKGKESWRQAQCKKMSINKRNDNIVSRSRVSNWRPRMLDALS